jgi:hypothetical protein
MRRPRRKCWVAEARSNEIFLAGRFWHDTHFQAMHSAGVWLSIKDDFVYGKATTFPSPSPNNYECGLQQAIVRAHGVLDTAGTAIPVLSLFSKRGTSVLQPNLQLCLVEELREPLTS